MGKVYVIGAGCPVGADIDAPLARNVFTWAVRHDRFPKFGDGERALLGKVGIDALSLRQDKPPFEEALGKISGYIHECIPETGRPVSRDDVEGIALAADASELARKLIHQFWDLLRPPIGNRVTSTLLQLAERMTLDDSIVSFNYDTLLEIALLTLEKLDPIHCYAIPFRYKLSHRKKLQRLRTVSKARGIPFLKLHGSINWVRCWGHKTENFSVAPGDQKVCPKGTLAVVPADYPHAWADGYKDFVEYPRKEFWEVFAVPAAADKRKQFREHPEVWGPLWEKARLLLMNADEIVIVGYSLPHSDALANQLFREVLGSRNARRRMLHVADPCDSVHRRYRSLLNQGVDYRAYASLKQFLDTKPQFSV